MFLYSVHISIKFILSTYRIARLISKKPKVPTVLRHCALKFSLCNLSAWLYIPHSRKVSRQKIAYNFPSIFHFTAYEKGKTCMDFMWIYHEHGSFSIDKNIMRVMYTLWLYNRMRGFSHSVLNLLKWLFYLVVLLSINS